MDLFRFSFYVFLKNSWIVHCLYFRFVRSNLQYSQAHFTQTSGMPNPFPENGVIPHPMGPNTHALRQRSFRNFRFGKPRKDLMMCLCMFLAVLFNVFSRSVFRMALRLVLFRRHRFFQSAFRCLFRLAFWFLFYDSPLWQPFGSIRDILSSETVSRALAAPVVVSILVWRCRKYYSETN